jgi:HAMP domain-containing protein
MAIAVDDFWEVFESLEGAFRELSRARDQFEFERIQHRASPQKSAEIQTLSAQIDEVEQALLLIRRHLEFAPLSDYQQVGEDFKFEAIE